MAQGPVARLRARLTPAPQKEAGAPFALPDLHSPKRSGASRTVAVLVFTGVTTAEIDEPVRRLAEGLDAEVTYVGDSRAPVVGVEAVRTVHIDATFDEALRPTVLVLPGGLGWQRVAEDEAAMRWVVSVAERAEGVLAISTGTLILASAGRLAGQVATGHWLAREALADLGADVSTERTVQSADSRVVTASGATAALSVCETFAERLRWGP